MRGRRRESVFKAPIFHHKYIEHTFHIESENLNCTPIIIIACSKLYCSTKMLMAHDKLNQMLQEKNDNATAATAYF